MSQIVTRIAPSPTGHAHIGFYRTAIFNYLFTKKNKGKFLLRIEDTDKQRSKEEYTEGIYEALEWLGLNYDSKTIQSENVELHKKYLLKLIEDDKAYISKEEAKDGSGVIKEIVRFRNPNQIVTFTDLVLGTISVDTTDLGDFVIARNINDPLFHLAVVVDDATSGVTHVIRGMDHVSNTPRHILIGEAIGFDIPQYAHIPLVIGDDKGKLSKRKGALAVIEYKKMGYMKEAIFNFATFIGFNPGGEKEIYSVDELIEVFDLSRVQKSSATFNPVKLDWYNSEYIKALSNEEFLKRVKEYFNYIDIHFPNIDQVLLDKLLLVSKERIKNFGELKDVDNLLDFDTSDILNTIQIPEKTKKDKVVTNADIKNILIDITKILENLDDTDFESTNNIKDIIWPYSEEKGRGIVLWSLRVALSAKEKSLDPFNMIYVLGKERTFLRLNQVINML
jgi:glutamyl-tRNA synthetase